MKKLVIVISGEPGAGTSTIAKKVAEKLHLKYLSPGKTFKNYLDEDETDAALDFWQTKFGKSKKLHEMLDADQIKAAKKGNVVICGKLSIHFIKKYATLTVWLNVPLDVRARRSSGRDGISFEEAKKDIFEREQLERNQWKKMYGFDYLNQKDEANLVLDSSDMTVEETVDAILEKMK